MDKINMVLPKGRLYKKVITLLNDAGLGIEVDEGCYIPGVQNPEFEVKIMKPQNIPLLVEMGSHDIGFSGFDWITETGARVEEVMDLGFDPVEIVAAVPAYLEEVDLFSRRLIVASEYEKIAEDYLKSRNYGYRLIRTFGATEVFPPDDADMIIDNVSSGRTLKTHNLKIVGRLISSSTRMIVNKQVKKNTWKMKKLTELITLISSVINARERVMLEMNVPMDRFEKIVSELPCMRAPTVSPLYRNEGYAIRIAVPRSDISRLIPWLKSKGATDIVEYESRKVVS